MDSAWGLPLAAIDARVCFAISILGFAAMLRQPVHSLLCLVFRIEISSCLTVGFVSEAFCKIS